MKKFTKSEATQIVQNIVFGITDTGQAKRWVEAFEALELIELKEEEEKPIFEITCIGRIFDTHIKIYSNGRVEGIDGIIVNRIPEFIKINS